MSDILEKPMHDENEPNGAVFYDTDAFLSDELASEVFDADDPDEDLTREDDPKIAQRRISNFMREHFERLADDEISYDFSDEDTESAVYMQNRELSWLSFNERVLDQGADDTVPLLERLNFISIFSQNLQEFFMVRVGSLTDLLSIDPPVRDSKTHMTAKQQLKAIYKRCRQLYPIQESIYEHVRGLLAQQGIRHVRPGDLTPEQTDYLRDIVRNNVEPFLSPQIINSRHPFPHLENEKLYILVRLDNKDELERKKTKKQRDKDKSSKKDKGAKDVLLGLIPLPHQCERVVRLPGPGLSFILLEHAIEMFAADVFSMYKTKHTNVIRVTRSADIDADEGGDELDDYRDHMRRLLKRRDRLAPVRLECERPLSSVTEALLLKKLKLKRNQVFSTQVPLSMSFVTDVVQMIDEKKRAALTYSPFTPAWPVCLDRNKPIMEQVAERDTLLFFPYESIDPFVMLLREAAQDPSVISIKITLYRLAQQSHLAEALIAAAEAGKEVCALFELRARFDENNNIEWSHRFERAGCTVIYGFKDLKVHSKMCCITRKLPDGKIQHITQLGTGNYNEKTAKLYTDLCYITSNEAFARDGMEFFRNMQLENISDNYNIISVAPLQIKQMILREFDTQIKLAKAGLPSGAFLKANSLTDKDIIEKIAEASQAGVPVTLLIRGICCLVPGIPDETEDVRVVSLIGRLLEHSRIYCFGQGEDCQVYLSSADLMTRNLDKRVEVAWPLLDPELKRRILIYISVCMHDTAKLRELRPNGTYTPLGSFTNLDQDDNPKPPYDSQATLIEEAALAATHAARESFRDSSYDAQLKTSEGNTAYSLYDEPASPDSLSRPLVRPARQMQSFVPPTPVYERNAEILPGNFPLEAESYPPNGFENPLTIQEVIQSNNDDNIEFPEDFEEVEVNEPAFNEENSTDSESNLPLEEISSETIVGVQPYPQGFSQATGPLPPYQTGQMNVVSDPANQSSYQTGALPPYYTGPTGLPVLPSLQNLPNIQIGKEESAQLYDLAATNDMDQITGSIPYQNETVVPYIPVDQLPTINAASYARDSQTQLTDMTINDIMSQNQLSMSGPLMPVAQMPPVIPYAHPQSTMPQIQSEESSYFTPRKQEIVMPPEKRGFFKKK